MNLSQMLTESLIRIGLDRRDKPGIIGELVDILAGAGKVPDRALLVAAALEREAKGSTGLARGIAVPHCKAPGLSALVCSLAISAEGIDFEAQDGKPSHIFIFLAAPVGMSGPHIRALANIARLSGNEEFLRSLRGATSPGEALRIIAGEETRVE